ncbi:MAG: MBL fold metallo-hydrolase [Leptospirales bacterium]|nr:MBL fold metallo-hydrolase [Leptospirales bacterium]
MRQATVLGSGNAFNSGGRAHAAYLLDSSGGERLLLDCGATTQLRLQQMNVDSLSIDAIALTHFHGDHFGGLPFLLLDMDILRQRQAPLTILGPQGVQAAVQSLLQVCYPGYWPGFDLRFVETVSGEERQIGEFFILALRMDHQPESLGYRITGPAGRSVAFSGDARLNESLQQLVRDVDLALVELTMETQTTPPVAHIALDEILGQRFPLSCRRLVYTHIHDTLAEAVVRLGLGEAASDGARYSLE